MIVPRTRLILWTALIVLPFAAAGATLPGALPVSLFFIGGLFMAALFDAAIAPRGLAGIRVVLPELVRLQKDRPGTLELRLHNDSPGGRTLRIGLAFPPEIASSSDDRITAL